MTSETTDSLDIKAKVVTYEEGQALKKEYVCAECAGILEVAWGGAFGISGYILRCGVDVTHQGIVKRGRYKKEEQPIYIQNILERKEREEMVETYGEEKTTELEQYRGMTSLTSEQATKLLMACWPDAPADAVFKGAAICAQYGLNPLMKHLHLVKFHVKSGEKWVDQWVPILGISATRLIASRNRKYTYEDGPRIMTTQEQRELLGEEYPDRIWAITVIADEAGNHAPGYGSLDKTDKIHGEDKGNTRANMAMIRSERAAFDRLLPGEMPQGIEVIDLEFTAAPLIRKGRTETEAPPKQIEKPKASSRTPGISDVNLAEMNQILDELGVDQIGADFVGFLEGKFNVTEIKQLSDPQAVKLLATLKAKLDIKREEEAKAGGPEELPF